MLNLNTRISRPVAHRLTVALIVAAVAGTAFVLGLSAVLDATWDPRGAIILALAAVWIPQTLIAANRRRH